MQTNGIHGHNDQSDKRSFLIDIKQVRWFYQGLDLDRTNKTKNKYASKWTQFNKLDSFRLEMEYRNTNTEANDTNRMVQVLDGLYEVIIV